MESTHFNIKWIVIGAAIATITALYYINPVEYLFVPKCMFKYFTGLSCPGCGLQRAIHALLHGDITGAIKYNYFLIYSGPYAIILIAERWFMPEGELQTRIRRVAEHRYAAYTYIVLFVAWFATRNIYGI